MRSTRPAARNAPASSPPPSSSTRVRPRSARAAAMARGSGRPSASDATSMSCDARRAGAPDVAPRRYPAVVMTQVATSCAGPHHLRRHRQPETAVGDDANRRPVFHAGQPAGERRIVGERRSGADEDGIVARPQTMRLGTRLLAGDPLAVAARRRDPPVERGGELQRDHRPSPCHPQKEAEVDLRRLLPADAGRNATPASRRRAMPRPETRGSGSSAATTTRPMPASISASLARAR